jgi:hypothetical protein
MSLQKIFPVILLLSVTLIGACKKDKIKPSDPLPPTPEELFYTHCGQVPPLFGCINGASIFMPNAFSANNDGYNDLFFPFSGYGIDKVISFKIYDADQNLVFENSHFWPNELSYGWDGKHPDGSIQNGIYTYTVSYATTYGEVADFEGTVCCRTSLPLSCVEHEKYIAWGTQHNGNGGFTSALPAFETCE